MYVHAVEVLASTRSPALNTGPFPASRLRTVRSTIRPSSAIQRRSQAPRNIRSAETATPAANTTLVTRRGRPGREVPGRPASVSSTPSTTSEEVDSTTDHQNPDDGEQLQDPVL